MNLHPRDPLCRCFRFFLLPGIFSLALCGCAGRTGTAENREKPGQAASVQISAAWFYFDRDGKLTPAGHPAEIPVAEFRPWTEVPAVMDAGFADDRPVLLVNKNGLLSPDQFAGPVSPDTLFPSADALASGTAAAFVSAGGETYIRFYRSTVFDADRSVQPVALFRAGRAPAFPLEPAAFAADFGMEENAQMVALEYSGGPEPWTAAFKSRLDPADSVSFAYLAFSALPVSSGFRGRSISAEEFRNAAGRGAAGQIPAVFTELLAPLPENQDVLLHITRKGSPATQMWSSAFSAGPAGSGTNGTLEGWAFADDAFAAVLFADGTCYLKPVNSGGGIKALRFPALNRGYRYTAFAVSGRHILAGWEESRFYETGRSGILAVTLPPGFYPESGS